MQLRVARLCLDCEEVYAGESCPVCASERYAFLSTWLPSEERRKWRRSGPRAAREGNGLFQAIGRALSRWFGDGDPDEARRGLRTRASDHIPDLSFEAPAKAPKARKPRPAHARQPVVRS